MSEAQEIVDEGTPTFVNRPMFRENSPATEIVGMEGANNQGRSLVSTLFEQPMSPLSGDLLNIEMKIKGDPYWLEPDPVTGEGFSTYRNRRPLNSSTTNNSNNTQTYFLFRSFLPDSPDPVTGITPGGSQNTVINGIYFVKETLSEFSRGAFTQTLFAIRDPSVNVNNIKFDGDGNPIIEEIRAVEEQSTSSSQTQDNDSTVTQQRIEGLGQAIENIRRTQQQLASQPITNEEQRVALIDNLRRQDAEIARITNLRQSLIEDSES